MKAPVLIREIRIWRKCPEIRDLVTKSLFYRLVLVMVAIPTLIITLPPALIYTVGQCVGIGIERFNDYVTRPARWVNRQIDNSIREAHKIMPPKVVRARLEGEL